MSFEPASRQVAGLTFEIEDVVQVFRLTDLEVVENPECLHLLAAFRVEHPEVLPYSDVVSYPVVVQPPYPFLTDELPVGQQAVDGIQTEKADVALHEVDAFLGVGGSLFGQHGEQQRIGDAVVDDSEHEDVDVSLAELPVGAVDCQAVLLLPGQLLKDKFRDKVLTNRMFGEKPLYSPQTRIGFCRRVETGGKFAEAHRPGLA